MGHHGQYSHLADVARRHRPLLPRRHRGSPGHGLRRTEGHQYTQGAVTDSIVSSSINRWSPSGCGYDVHETAQSGGGWYFDLDAGATLTLYADGKYTIGLYGSEPGEEIFVPGQSDRQVTLREGLHRHRHRQR